MRVKPLDTNVLYYGDNLKIIRDHIPDNSVDLIYLDPPFNSKATYNVLYKEPSGKSSQAQIEAFEDSWQWNLESERVLQEIAVSAIATAETKEFISVLPNFVGQRTPMRAYLTMMAIRLIELKRVLKDTGSIYLHCDPTASHYLKILMDMIFGADNFCNHIVWQRSDTHNDAKYQFSAISDHLLFYRKSNKQNFHKQYVTHPDKTLREWYLYLELPDGSVRRMTQDEIETQVIPDGARRFNTGDLTSPNPRPNLMYDYKGYPYPPKGWRCSKERMEKLDNKGLLLFPTDPKGRIMFKRYLDEQEGVTVGDIWADISQLRATTSERLGYATQKPEALLERIIQSSSNEGDIVLDPFCGCGTAVVAAQRLNRKWIGIDITHLAIGLMKWRLRNMTPPAAFTVVGEPEDPAGAVELAEQDKYQFQWWAVHKIGGQPYGDKKKGADTGIDGYLYYMDEKDKIKKAIISVKGGHNANVSMIRDLGHVIEREKSDIGVFILLDKPTRPMLEEAALKGFYHSPNGRDYPRIQILTIEDIFQGKTADTPSWLAPIPKAPTVKKVKGKTVRMI